MNNVYVCVLVEFPFQSLMVLVQCGECVAEYAYRPSCSVRSGRLFIVFRIFGVFFLSQKGAPLKIMFCIVSRVAPRGVPHRAGCL